MQDQHSKGMYLMETVDMEAEAKRTRSVSKLRHQILRSKRIVRQCKIWVQSPAKYTTWKQMA